MGLFQRIFRTNDRNRGPDVSFLTEQLASDIRLFSSVRGRIALLNPGAALVMNHLYETYITQDLSMITDRRGIVAVVKIPDLKSCEQVRFLRGEDLRGPAGTAVVYSLAAQAATELLRQSVGENHPALSRHAERSMQ